jgi:hypothetical protein
VNERICELAEQAGLVTLQHSDEWLDVEKFAKLIVRECAVYCEGHILPKGMAEENDLNYNDGVMDCAIGLKQHFGVEE